MNSSTATAMPKQTSTLNFISVVDYLNSLYPDIQFQSIMDEINSENPYYVENLSTGKIELISEQHIRDENYWISNLCMNALFNTVYRHVSEPDFFYNAGKSLIHTQHFLKTAIGIPLIGPEQLLQRSQKENNKLNRTKKLIITESEKGHVVLRAVHHKGIVVSEHGMQWGRGLIEAYTMLTGAADVYVTAECIEKGPQHPEEEGQGIWEFDIRYKDPGIVRRLFKALIFSLPMVRNEMQKANQIQKDHKEQVIHRDRIIQERTRALVEEQKKIIAAEKKNTRLKLQSLVTEMTEIEERERKEIIENHHF